MSEELVNKIADHHHDEVEAACEAALAGGVHGVMLAADGRIEADPEVPYGQIHEIEGHTGAWVLRHMERQGRGADGQLR